MSEDFRKFDSQAELTIHNARVAQEPKIIKEGFMKFTTVLTSSNENDIEVWWTVIPQERDFELAQYIQKGDVFTVVGFPTANLWGENDKMEHVLKFPRLRYPISLLKTLRERQDAAGGAKGKATAKPVAKGNGTLTKRVSRIQLDDDFQDA